MNEMSTLGKLLPPMMRYVKLGAKVLPKTLPESIAKFLPQEVELSLPLINALSSYFKILEEGMNGKKKIIVHPFNFPPEILHTLDTAPVFIELISTLASIAPGTFFPDKAEKYLDYSYEDGLPGSLCAGQLGGTGAMLMGDFPRPDAILSGAAGFCDVNSKIMEYAANKLKIPTFHMDMSSYNDERGLAYYKQSFKHVISLLEEFTGNKLDPDRLKETVEISNKMTELADEIFELQAAVPSPILVDYNLMNLMMRFSLGGCPETIPFYKAVLKSAKRKVKKGEGALKEEKVRCLWLYTGIYFDPMFFMWIKKIGMSVVSDLLSYFPVKPIDTTSFDTMIDGLAQEALDFPMVKQMKGAVDAPGGWIDDSVHLAKKFKVDCCIYFGNPACKRASGSFRLLSDEIKNEVGIPVLQLESDAWDGRVAPIGETKEKIEEFLETVI